MKASDLHQHMRELGTWVDWSDTTDGFKAGDPEAEVTGVAVGWCSLMSSLERAHQLGCNLFVTHEPTFYCHMDDEQQWRDTEAAGRKMDFLRETGMVVYRCHDVWDRVPEVGITDSWGQFLGLGAPVKKQGYYNLYQLEPQPVGELARRIATAVAGLGQPAVQVIGPVDKTVSRLVIGTGAATNVPTMFAMGADVILASDDGLKYWQHGTWAIDHGLPLIVVHHATSEIPGMKSLAEYLRRRYADVKVEYVGPGCLYSLVAAPHGGSA